MTHKWFFNVSDMSTPQLGNLHNARRIYRSDLAKLASEKHKGFWVAKAMAHGWPTVRVGVARSQRWRCEYRDKNGEMDPGVLVRVFGTVRLQGFGIVTQPGGDRGLGLFCSFWRGWFGMVWFGLVWRAGKCNF